MLAIMTELSAITAANKSEYGRLAQLVEHLLDVQGVRGSSPLASTIKKTRLRACFFYGFREILDTAGENEFPLRGFGALAPPARRPVKGLWGRGKTLLWFAALFAESPWAMAPKGFFDLLVMC